MIYYKVVTQQIDGKLISCIADDPRLLVIYELGRWSFPKLKGSKLFIFKTPENATDFVKIIHRGHSSKTYYIYQCEAKQVVKSAPCRRYYFMNTDMEIIKTIWKRYKNKKKYTNLTNECAPKGTLWADVVKLTDLLITIPA
uniref:Uncharacterized protein n=1 Tax=viral metagenome TaxID=1070528 RepID=A0A6M3JQE9_9ZZZZ